MTENNQTTKGNKVALETRIYSLALFGYGIIAFLGCYWSLLVNQNNNKIFMSILATKSPLLVVVLGLTICIYLVFQFVFLVVLLNNGVLPEDPLKISVVLFFLLLFGIPKLFPQAYQFSELSYYLFATWNLFIIIHGLIIR